MSWSEAPPGRRRLLAAAGGAVAVQLAGCGFAPRQLPALPFERIAFSGFASRSPMADELGRALAGRATVTSAPGSAQVVLQALEEARERSVVAQTSAAQVRVLQLRLRFRFRALNPAGRELVPPTTLALARDMTYNEAVALAKELEEADVFREMQADIAAQVMRRLALVRP